MKVYHYPELLLLISLSFFGLFLTGILAIFPPATQDLQFRKPLIGSIFGLICILGIIAAFSPRKCSRIFYCEKEGSSSRHNSKVGLVASSNTSSIFGLKIVHGHHPNCENFSAHEFQIGNKTFCTGCIGLILGGLINLFGTIMYFSNNWQITKESPFFIYIGIIGVVFGLLTPLFNFRRTILRLSLNAFFIFGMFSILIGADMLGQSLFIDLFLISLSVFWLFTRISLSQWNHKRICYICGIRCEFIRE